MNPSDVVERVGRDIVRLSFAYQRVVLEEELHFGAIELGLRFEHPFRFGSAVGGLVDPTVIHNSRNEPGDVHVFNIEPKGFPGGGGKLVPCGQHWTYEYRTNQ